MAFIATSTVLYARSGKLIKTTLLPYNTRKYTGSDGHTYDWSSYLIGTTAFYDSWIRYQVYFNNTLVEESPTWFVQFSGNSSCRAWKYNNYPTLPTTNNQTIYSTVSSTPAYKIKSSLTQTGTWKIKMRTCHHNYYNGSEYGAQQMYTAAGYVCDSSHSQWVGNGCQGSYQTNTTLDLETINIATTTQYVTTTITKIKDLTMNTTTQIAVQSASYTLIAIALVASLVMGILISKLLTRK